MQQPEKLTAEQRKQVFTQMVEWVNKTDPEVFRSQSKFDDLGEDMKLLKLSINGWWKPVMLVDMRSRETTLFMEPESLTLCCTLDEEIDWASLEGLDDKIIDRVKRRSAVYPTNIRMFSDGLAEVEWQVNPDGQYYRDSDGFGMTDDEEISLFGYIDRKGDMAVPFTFIGYDRQRDYDKLEALRQAALHKAKS